jgi:hypothetical protein
MLSELGAWAGCPLGEGGAGSSLYDWPDGNKKNVAKVFGQNFGAMSISETKSNWFYLEGAEPRKVMLQPLYHWHQPRNLKTHK